MNKEKKRNKNVISITILRYACYFLPSKYKRVFSSKIKGKF